MIYLKEKQKNKPSILLIGRGTVAVQILQILKNKNYIPQVIICDATDSGIDTWTKSLLKKAFLLGFKMNDNLFVQRNVNDIDFITELKLKHPKIDYIFSVQPKQIFKKTFIRVARKQIFNLHFAPLPKLRGVQTSSWAILDGLKIMGVSIHLITKTGIDNDPIVFQSFFRINDSDTAWLIFKKSEAYGISLFKDKVEHMLKGEYSAKPQNEDEATYHGLNELDYKDLRIPDSTTFNDLSKFIRARIFPPLQLPYLIHKNRKYFITKVLYSEEDNVTHKKLNKNGSIFTILCRDGLLLVRTKLNRN